MPGELPVALDDQDGPRPPAGAAQADEDLADGLLGPGGADVRADPHQVLDPPELPPEVAAGVIQGEVLGPEVAHPADQQARASPTAIKAVVLAEGASPSGHASSIGPSAMQTSARRPSELPAPLGEGDQGRAQPPQGGDQAEDFLGLAALRERQHDVPGADAAEVAVDGLGRVEREGPGAGGGERRGELLPDQPRLAHAGDDDARPGSGGPAPPPARSTRRAGRAPARSRRPRPAGRLGRRPGPRAPSRCPPPGPRRASAIVAIVCLLARRGRSSRFPERDHIPTPPSRQRGLTPGQDGCESSMSVVSGQWSV